jgi:hypothetical protein
MLPLTGKNMVVIGGSRGIGRSGRCSKPFIAAFFACRTRGNDQLPPRRPRGFEVDQIAKGIIKKHTNNPPLTRAN